jgi:hypothetical protein
VLQYILLVPYYSSLSTTVTVKEVSESVELGVPVINPVEVLKDSPDGREGEIE